MTFQYASDIGDDSIKGIEAAENASKIPHTVVSTYRAGSITLSGHLSYHARKNAVDASSSPVNMRSLAQWIADHYGPYTLELIHSTGPGYFIHNGKIVGASYYGAAIVNRHYDHVHWAITNSGLAAGGASVVGVQAINASYDPKTNNGCAFGIVAGLASASVVLGGIGSIVVHLL